MKQSRDPPMLQGQQHLNQTDHACGRRRVPDMSFGAAYGAEVLLAGELPERAHQRVGLNRIA